MNQKPPCNCADWGMMECLTSCDSNKSWADIIKERDELKSKLYIAETALKAATGTPKKT
jgi:hypothetical protein